MGCSEVSLGVLAFLGVHSVFDSDFNLFLGGLLPRVLGSRLRMAGPAEGHLVAPMQASGVRAGKIIRLDF